MDRLAGQFTAEGPVDKLVLFHPTQTIKGGGHHPHLQVITTADSPFVLDALDAAQVLVAGSAPDGFTRIEALSAHPSWAKRRDYTSVGEFWSDIGEGWVAAPS